MTADSVRYLPATTPTWSRETDVVVVGAGAAGLSAAVELARRGRRVIVLAKAGLESGATPHAQGGLAAAMGPGDTYASHVEDTLVAAAGLGDENAVRALVQAAPATVRYLASLGARFDDGPPGLEGGHSHHRIVHAGGDAIGAELHRTLRTALSHLDVEVLEDVVAIDTLRSSRGTVLGLLAGRRGPTRRLDVGVIESRAVVIATGGFGQAYPTSTNPAEVTGDGLALAARSGARLANVEFVQFHPTVMYLPGHRGQSPLITEAIRGAGATIVDANGTSVMRGRHERGDLAPRDVVSFAMFERMHDRVDPLEHLWLDARSIGRRRLEQAFPTTVSLCRAAGVDPVDELVAIAPGAHYACGGIVADLDGATSVRGLYAIGEAAATGVHGANRLASNSLTEAVFTGRRVAARLDHVLAEPRDTDAVTAAPDGRGIDPVVREALATAMASHVGVVRDRDGLDEMLSTLDGVPDAPAGGVDLDVLEATNLHTVSLLVTVGAARREESRGAHRRRDFPDVSDRWRHPIVLTVLDGRVDVDAPAGARS